MLSRPRLARLLLTDPAPSDYDPILLSLIKTILPFEHPRFPKLTPADVRGRFLKLFPLEEEKQFALLRKSLALFDDMGLFPHAFAPMREEERIAWRDGGGVSSSGLDRLLEEKRLGEEKAYAHFRRAGHGGAGSFAAAGPEGRLAYLDLWSQSGFLLKRRFYRTSKAMVMISAFTTPEMWESIGYAGPLLPSG